MPNGIDADSTSAGDLVGVPLDRPLDRFEATNDIVEPFEVLERLEPAFEAREALGDLVDGAKVTGDGDGGQCGHGESAPNEVL
jgi:hypothetical protein